jgi:hypothetical protein
MGGCRLEKLYERKYATKIEGFKVKIDIELP